MRRAQAEPAAAGWAPAARHQLPTPGRAAPRSRTAIRRCAGAPVEDVDIAGLGDLRDRVDTATLAHYGDQAGCGGKVPVPDIVADGLEVPYPITRACIERQHAVGEKVVAVTIGAVEVERRRSGRREHEPGRGVDGHAGPRVGAAGDLVGVGRPGVVAELTRRRDGTKHPPLLPRTHVEGANVTRRSGQRFRNAAPHDEQVLEDHARGAGANAQRLGWSAEPLPKVDSPLLSERGNWLARLPVERPKIAAGGDEHPVVVNRDATMPRSCPRRAARGDRVEAPL